MKKEVWRFREPLGRKPRGGWRWRDHGAHHEANTFKDLYLLVQMGRRGEGISCEGLRQEMIDKFCEDNPHMGIRVQVEVTGAPEETPEERTISWIKHLLKLDIKYVDLSDVKKRRKTCKMCPHNTRIKYQQDYTKEKVFNLTRGTVDDFLGVCEELNHDNNIATVIEQEEGIIIPDNLPECCWIKRK